MAEPIYESLVPGQKYNILFSQPNEVHQYTFLGAAIDPINAEFVLVFRYKTRNIQFTQKMYENVLRVFKAT
jgi:hypothetical protein